MLGSGCIRAPRLVSSMVVVQGYLHNARQGLRRDLLNNIRWLARTASWSLAEREAGCFPARAVCWLQLRTFASVIQRTTRRTNPIIFQRNEALNEQCDGRSAEGYDVGESCCCHGSIQTGCGVSAQSQCTYHCGRLIQSGST